MFTRYVKEHQPNKTGKYRAKGRHMPFLTQQNAEHQQTDTYQTS